MVTPLVFRHGAAEVAFTVLLLTWAVFETVMRGLQALRAKGPGSGEFGAGTIRVSAADPPR